jgi:hypothetical protein
MIERQFTCANNLAEPTYEKLDRVLMDSDWEDKFPMVSVRVLECIEALSDHAPILLTTRSPRSQCARRFKFELGWLHKKGFYDMVKAAWEHPAYGQSPIERWNRKIRAVHKHLGGWARHTTGILKNKNYDFWLSLIL